MDCTRVDLQKAADAILNHSCYRKKAVDWLVLVAIMIVVSLTVVWTATRRPVHCNREEPFMMNFAVDSLSPPASIELLHTSPCIRLIKNFISDKEANSLISTYKHKLKPSTVSADDSNQSSTSSRSSSTAFLPAGSSQHLTIKSVEERLVLLTGFGLTHWETLQLTQYRKGQQYKPHFDWFDHASNNRAVTVFIYLNNVSEEDGGQTEFTDINLSVQPTLGNAIVWYNCAARGDNVVCDNKTKHAGRPPKHGEKFGLNCWARTSPYR